MKDELFNDLIESIKSLPTHVLIEMEKNMKEHNIPNQYYKHLESGVEMLFSFDTQQGWSVSFMNLEGKNDVNFPVPFPEDPKQYKVQIYMFYKNLEKKYQDWSKV